MFAFTNKDGGMGCLEEEQNTKYKQFELDTSNNSKKRSKKYIQISTWVGEHSKRILPSNLCCHSFSIVSLTFSPIIHDYP